MTAGPTIPLPPPILDGEDFPRLNTWFYAVEPHEYFDKRLGLLVVQAGKPDAVESIIRGGVEYEGFRIGGPGLAGDGEARRDDPRDDEEDARRHVQYVIAESVALLHYVSETLLRFYFAHVGLPPCPWLEIAKELNHVSFKKRIEARFDGAELTDERRRDVAQVFFPSASSPPSGATREAWLEGIENLEQWLTHFAHWFLDESNLFNSVKHGLAVHPGKSGIELNTPEDERLGRNPPLIHAKGPSVAFLEKTGDPRRWHYTTRWVEPQRLMAETVMALRLLRGIWQIGRIRYTDLEKGRVRLDLFTQPGHKEYLDSFLEPGENARLIINRMSMDLGYRYAYGPELVCVKCGRKPEPGELAQTTWRGKAEPCSVLEPFCPQCATLAG